MVFRRSDAVSVYVNGGGGGQRGSPPPRQHSQTKVMRMVGGPRVV